MTAVVTDRPRYAPTRVSLDPAEVAIAQQAGEGRYGRRRSSGSQHRWARRDDHSVAVEVEAVGAEIAVARVIGRGWRDTHSPDYDGDVCPGVQVRHTRSGRLLLLHGPESTGRQDRDDHDYFLVTGVFPSYTVHGWVTGARGKRIGRVRELQAGRPCITVEANQLAAPDQWAEHSRWA